MKINRFFMEKYKEDIMDIVCRDNSYGSTTSYLMFGTRRNEKVTLKACDELKNEGKIKLVNYRWILVTPPPFESQNVR